MKHVIINLILLLPWLISCQQLPIEELKKKGVTQEEINLTSALIGENGANDYYLIFRQKNTSQNPNMKLLINNYELYTPGGALIPLTKHKHTQSELFFFEFLGDEIMLIEKVFGLRKQIRISKYHTKVENLKTLITAEIPCKSKNDCEWINYEENKLAFFTNLEANEGLEQSSIYEYDWITDEIKLIFGKLPMSIDAATGRNFALSDVRFNRNNKNFEYIQE